MQEYTRPSPPQKKCKVPPLRTGSTPCFTHALDKGCVIGRTFGRARRTGSGISRARVRACSLWIRMRAHLTPPPFSGERRKLRRTEEREDKKRR